MKFAAFNWNGSCRLGLVDETNGVISRFDVPHPVCEQAGVTALIGQELPRVVEDCNLVNVQLLAPVPRPHRNVFCVGKNYHDHAKEFSRSGFDSSAAKGEVPEAPIVFSKVPQSVIGPGKPIRIDEQVSTAVDYEVELGVIVGKPGRNIRPENALEHVWAYTIINDVTARDLQGIHSQWLIGKSQDTFCPMGPWVVLRDELNLSDAGVRCFVNGECRQNSNTGLLIFDVPTIVAAISNGIELMPGDIIATEPQQALELGLSHLNIWCQVTNFDWKLMASAHWKTQLRRGNG